MKPSEIMQLPHVVNNVHESVYRSYGILCIVKRWLALEVPQAIILEWIEDMDKPAAGQYPTRRETAQG